MKVHHLNCGTMRPWTVRAGLVCHVLLVETPGGLVLIDSGLGLRDIESPAQRFGPTRYFTRPVFDPAEAAINQVRALGFDPADVRHIVLTHFDADHIGGIADFPWASVHLTDTEAYAARERQTLLERNRYSPAGVAHRPTLVEHSPPASESWRGFPGAIDLGEIADGIVLISLPGHTRGHAAVAVDAGASWILHAGDSFYHHGQLDGSHTAPRAMTALERMVAFDWPMVRANHERLKELWSADDPGMVLINAHDPALYRRAPK